jgi:hypothetical protein
MCDGANETAAAHAYETWLSSWFAHDAAILARAYRDVGLFGFDDPPPASRYSEHSF